MGIRVGINNSGIQDTILDIIPPISLGLGDGLGHGITGVIGVAGGSESTATLFQLLFFKN